MTQRCANAARCHCPEPVYKQRLCLRHWLWLNAHPGVKPSRAAWVQAQFEAMTSKGRIVRKVKS